MYRVDLKLQRLEKVEDYREKERKLNQKLEGLKQLVVEKLNLLSIKIEKI